MIKITKFNFTLWLTLSLVFCFFQAPSLWAQIQVQTELSSSTLYLGDEIRAQLKVDGAQRGIKLKFPQVEGLSFRQLGRPSASSQTIIVNGKVSSFKGLVYDIGISAEKIGTFYIPGFQVTHQSKVYQGQSFRLRVKAVNQQSSMKLLTEVIPSHIYLQQPLLVTLKWYIQDNVEDYTFRFPLLEQKDELQLELVENNQGQKTTSLTVSGYNIPFHQSNEVLKGKEYTTLQTTFRIFPQVAGDFRIPKATMKAMIQVGTERKQDYFGRIVRSPKLESTFVISEEKIIPVLALPQKNRPHDFTGAVGQFDIQLSSKINRTKVGDPVEMTIRISGQGQLEKMDPPLLSGVEEYRKNFVTVDNLQPGDIQGDSITFLQVVRARHEDVERLPPVSFSYFDPKQEQYVTIHSNSLPLQVLKTQRVKISDIILPQRQLASAMSKNFQETGRGIHANYTFADALETQTQSWVWILFLILPPGTYFACLILVSRKRELAGNKALIRSKAAKTMQKKRLKKAEQLLPEQDHEFYMELSQALSGFISDRLNLGQGELTVMDVKKLQQENKIPTQLSGDIREQLESFDRIRFMNQSSTTEQRQEALITIQTLIKQLDKEL